MQICYADVIRHHAVSHQAERRLLDEQHRCLELTEDLKRLQQEVGSLGNLGISWVRKADKSMGPLNQGRAELATERRRMQTLREEQREAQPRSLYS